MASLKNTVQILPFEPKELLDISVSLKSTFIGATLSIYDPRYDIRHELIFNSSGELTATSTKMGKDYR